MYQKMQSSSSLGRRGAATSVGHVSLFVMISLAGVSMLLFYNYNSLNGEKKQVEERLSRAVLEQQEVDKKKIGTNARLHRTLSFVGFQEISWVWSVEELGAQLEKEQALVGEKETARKALSEENSGMLASWISIGVEN